MRFLHLTIVLIIVIVLLAISISPGWAESPIACNATTLINTITNASNGEILTLPDGCIISLTAVNNTTDGPNGLPSITQNLTINGLENGAIIERDSSASHFRILHIGSSGNLSLNNITIHNGHLPDDGSHGGGIYVGDGILELVNSAVISNSAGSGSKDSGGGLGGGLFVATGSLTLTNTLVMSNSAGRGGDGEFFFAGEGGDGGGIHIGSGGSGGDLMMVNSTVSGNSAGQGGDDVMGTGFGGGFGGAGGGIAIFVANTNVVLINSTVSGNRAGQGGFDDGIGGSGGGIFIDNSSLMLINSTLISNSTGHGTGSGDGGSGGGIWMSGISNVSIKNTVIASNSVATGGNGPDCWQASGTLTSMSYNFIGANDGCTGSFPAGNPNGNNDIVGTGVSPINPKLAPLADNGGATQTHAPLSNSPILDQGNCGSIVTDQRERPRPVDIPYIPNSLGGDGCDIGAYEVQLKIYLPIILKN